jgi:hypothetical protein
LAARGLIAGLGAGDQALEFGALGRVRSVSGVRTGPASRPITLMPALTIDTA